MRAFSMIDWARFSSELDSRGGAVLRRLIAASECVALVAFDTVDGRFRSGVIMANHGFGRGEYKYVSDPLREPIAGLRSVLYPQLAVVANRWNRALGMRARFPEEHAAFIKRCHAAGQRKPTPLLLQYGAGDYNCLHQDLYGEHVFPLQLTILLSEAERDFTGGEFVLSEQRPRKQTRGEGGPVRRGGPGGVAGDPPPGHRPPRNHRGTPRTGVN